MDSESPVSAVAIWLDRVDHAFASSELSEEAIDELVAQGLALQLESVAENDLAPLDVSRLHRAIHGFAERSNAIADELADLSHRRADFVRKQHGIAGYTAVADLTF